MGFPKIITNLDKLRFNAETVIRWCAEREISTGIVTKCVCADRTIVKTLEESRPAFLADSRIQNLTGMKTALPRLLLRIGMPDDAENIVQNCDISLQSEITTINALGRAASNAGLRHKIVLMIDTGDLREGVFAENLSEIISTAEAIASEPALEFYGTGTNLTCYGGVVPNKDNLGKLVEITKMLRERFNLPIPVISGGNSSSLGIMLREGLPEGINNLRVGEAILLGSDTAEGGLLPELYGDVFTLRAELVEIQLKPSVPVGKSNVNAFGETVSFEDKGPMRRGILALGRQDTDIQSLNACDARINIVGGSSDHLIVDLTEAPEYNVGDTIDFTPSYGALLHAFTSPYIIRNYAV